MPTRAPSQVASEGDSHESGLSCITCRRRKVRCNKKKPCTPCSRGGRECAYPSGRRRAAERRPRQSTINDVSTRLTQLESALRSNSCVGSVPARATSRVASPAPASLFEHSEPSGGRVAGETLVGISSSNQYFNEVLVSQVIERERKIRAALEIPVSPANVTPPIFDPMGILSMPTSPDQLSQYHPSKFTAVELWKIFLESFDSCMKIVHVPTTEVIIFTAIDKPHCATAEALALCYAIYYTAAVVLHSSASAESRGIDFATIIEQSKAGLEQCLACANFLANPTVGLLQAVAIYLTALRAYNPGRAVWILNGLAIRAAQSIGLHRDGVKLGLSPFQAEIRRRLWWHFQARDGRAAEDYGLQDAASLWGNQGVKLPLNLDDADINPDMVEQPKARVGWTRMTLGLVNVEIARAWATLSQFGLRNPDDDSLQQHRRSMVVEDLGRHVNYLIQDCSLLIPQQKFAAVVSRLILRKLEFVTRLQCLALDRPAEPEVLATEANLTEALGILNDVNNIQDDELLRPFRWCIGSYPQYHILLYILWHLCMHPETLAAKQALQAVENHLQRIGAAGRSLIQGPKWTVLLTLKAKVSGTGQPNAEGVAPCAGSPAPASQQGADGVSSTEASIEQCGEGIWPRIDSEAELMLPDWSSLIPDYFLDTVEFSTLFPNQHVPYFQGGFDVPSHEHNHV